MKITEKKLKKQALDFAKEKLGGKSTIYRTWSEGELLDEDYMETINEIKEEYGYTTREAIQDFLELRTVPKIVDNHTHM